MPVIITGFIIGFYTYPTQNKTNTPTYCDLRQWLHYMYMNLAHNRDGHVSYVHELDPVNRIEALQARMVAFSTVLAL